MRVRRIELSSSVALLASRAKGDSLGLAHGAGPKANGAGIAADPTLTDAWSAPEGENLASDVSTSDRQGRSDVSSPALAPASGSDLRRTAMAFGKPKLPIPDRARLHRAAPRSGCPWWSVPRADTSFPVRRPSTDASFGAPTGRPDPRRNVSRFLQRSPLRLAEAIARDHSRGARTDPAASSGFEIPSVFQAVRLSIPRCFVPFR